MDSNELARIRFVTERFTSLQGLRQVIAGAGLMSIVGVASAIRGWPPAEMAVFLAGIPGVTAIALGMRVAEKYYRQRFGRAPRNDDRWMWLPGLILGASIIADKLLGGSFFPGLLGVYVASFCAWTVVRDWPFRPHYLAGVVAGIAVILPWPVDPLVAAWHAKFPLYQGAAMVVLGYFDHRLLVRSLAPRHEGAVSNDHAV